MAGQDFPVATGGAAAADPDVVKIYSATAGSGGVASFATGTIDVSAYRSLQILFSGRTDSEGAAAGADGVEVHYNNDTTASNYVGVAHVAGRNTSNNDLNDTFVPSTPSLFAIPDNTVTPNSLLSSGVAWISLTGSSHYTTSTSQSMNFRGVTTTTFRLIYQYARTWKNTDSITRITLQPTAGGNFVEGSSCQILGVT